MDLRRQTQWLVVVAALSIVTLATVHALQRFGGYVPCELCLRQREVWWTVPAVALVTLALGRLRREAVAVGVVAVGVGLFVGFLVAGYHAGVEWRWWPGPTACTGAAPAKIGAAGVAAILNGTTRVHMVRCDEAALRIVGVSLSGWNALLSLALSLASFTVLVTRRR